MSTSPAATLHIPDVADVFDHLSHCERLLTAKELAGMLAISPKTIYSYVERNMIPYYRIEANIRFRASDIARWLRDHACARLELPQSTTAASSRVSRSTWR
jgi:excisionase family DNA binding protein